MSRSRTVWSSKRWQSNLGKEGWIAEASRNTLKQGGFSGIDCQASAPGRCGIIGNPTDIYGGRVLSCSVTARATCRLTMGETTELPEDLRLWKAAVARFPLDGPVKVEWST